MRAALADTGGFDHNGHTLRTLMRIDCPYPRWHGLNLTWETLEGLAKHNGPIVAPQWALAQADAEAGLALDTWPSLEAQVAALADDIAYDNHDIDDGVRAGLLTLDQVAAVPMVESALRRVEDDFAGFTRAQLRGELIRTQIGTMVNDLIAESRRRIAASGVETAADVRAAGGALIAFSDTMAADERALKRFMYANLYHHPLQLAAAQAAHRIVSGLFAAYRGDPASLPEEWRARLPVEEPALGRHLADFIAGMTDRYAIARYREVVGPIDLPEGF